MGGGSGTGYPICRDISLHVCRRHGIFTICSGNAIKTATNRAQDAADALLLWARRSKMTVSAEKTQMMGLP